MAEDHRAFHSEIRIRFTHCDAAGIVFYPRYFEMFNDLVEDWFREELGCPFAELHKVRHWGVPTVHLEVDFMAPSSFGEVLSATLTVRKLGTSSMSLEITFRGTDGRDRVRGTVVLVLTDRVKGGAIPIPEGIRSRIAKFLTSE